MICSTSETYQIYPLPKVCVFSEGSRYKVNPAENKTKFILMSINYKLSTAKSKT